MESLTRIAVAVVLLLIIGVATVPVFNAMKESGDTAVVPAPYAVPAIRTAAPPVATMAEFNQIQTGMTYEQVKAIVGTPGTMDSENNIAGIHSAMYSWRNDDLSGLMIMLQNGKVIQKSQFMLK